MIGLVIVTHGDFGEALLRAAEHVVGPFSQAAVVSIGEDDDMAAKRQAIADAVEASNSGEGVIIATDLFGGTPANLSVSLMKGNVEVLAGANLPMLIRFNGARHQPLAECAEALRDAGRKYISRASDILGDIPDRTSSGETIPHEDHKNEIANALERVADDLTQLQQMLRGHRKQDMLYGNIGHNLPPLEFTVEDDDLLDEGETAARVAADEMAQTEPSRDILKLCVNALKRVLRLLREIAQWALAKGDLFVSEAVKSAGKVVGPAIAVSAVVAQLNGQLSELINRLRTLTGL